MSGWRKIRENLREAFASEMDEKGLAAGFAVGVFFSFTPLISLHTVLALLVAFLFRLSKIAAVAGVWVNNPYTMPFVFYGCLRFGEWVLGTGFHPLAWDRWTLDAFLRMAAPLVVPLLVGTTIVGIAAAAVAYCIVYRIAVRVKSARQAEKTPPPVKAGG